MARPGAWLAAFGLLFALLLVGSGAARAAAGEAGDQTLEVALLRDPSRALRLADVMAPSAVFTPLRRPDVSLGGTRDAAWLRVRIHAATDGRAVLTLAPPFVDIVDVYVLPPAGGPPGAARHYALGDHRPLPIDDNAGLDAAITLDVAAATPREVYVRVVSVQSTLVLSLAVATVEEHARLTRLTNLAYGFWFGGMSMLVLIQGLFFLFDRRSSYLWLAAGSLSTVLVYCANLGVSRLLFFPGGGGGHDLFHASAVWFGMVAGSRAVASVLDLKDTAPRFDRLFKASAVVGLMFWGASLAGYNQQVMPWGNGVLIALFTTAAVLSVRFALRGGLGARLTAGAFILLHLGLLITLAQRSGALSLPNWTSHSYGVSAMAYTLLLTAGLAVRLREAERRGQTLQAAALRAARDAEDYANAQVAARTRELAAATRTAEEALQSELRAQRSQVRFMEVLSHHYRTPLASIRSNVDTIALSLPPGDTANQERVRRVRRGVARLVEVIEVNMARSRLEGASFQPALAPIVLGEVLRNVVARARELNTDAHLVVEVAPAAADARIAADTQMLGLALVNLIENAIKFSAGRDAAVTVRASAGGDEVSVAVVDGGIGIPAGEIDAVLARDYRASNAASIAGTGLGLSLVQRIVRAHNGTLTVESVEGVGTTMSIRLPVAGAAGGV